MSQRPGCVAVLQQLLHIHSPVTHMNASTLTVHSVWCGDPGFLLNVRGRGCPSAWGTASGAPTFYHCHYVCVYVRTVTPRLQLTCTYGEICPLLSVLNQIRMLPGIQREEDMPLAARALLAILRDPYVERIDGQGTTFVCPVSDVSPFALTPDGHRLRDAQLPMGAQLLLSLALCPSETSTILPVSAAAELRSVLSGTEGLLPGASWTDVSRACNDIVTRSTQFRLLSAIIREASTALCPQGATLYDRAPSHPLLSCLLVSWLPCCFLCAGLLPILLFCSA